MAMSMDRLLRISLSLEINIADLVGTREHEPVGDRRRSVTRSADGMSVRSNSGAVTYHAHDLLEKKITPMVAEITARSIEEFGPWHRHHGEEWVIVLEGELALHTDAYAPVHLKEGESIYFDSGMGHAYVAVGSGPCRIASTFTGAIATEMETVVTVPHLVAALGQATASRPGARAPSNIGRRGNGGRRGGAGRKKPRK